MTATALTVKSGWVRFHVHSDSTTAVKGVGNASSVSALAVGQNVLAVEAWRERPTR